MSDAEFILSFEEGRLPPEQFDHRAHLRAAFCYLSRHPFLEACVAMRDGLQRFAARIGKAGLYHETITVAFMSLMSERMQRHPQADWETFIARHSDLCERDLLSRYYRSETLASPLSRVSFLMGDACRKEVEA
ncbi:hypothetical protein [Piscinibacter terrae]|uniref:Uncharacterized protein n=1 Tax=Piscinibacter terrae TaxID=2496871 RepID=A0A3N7HMH2_9BURK|nr:hypothetical protein [Albitalea terrae]RQP23377.1 hypothetical protein DZC73_19995 [Albitalea terrae]